MRTPLHDLADALDALDGKSVTVTVVRNDWGYVRTTGDAGAPALDIKEVARMVSEQMARSANAEGLI